jgi:16S rRNA (uracil1498-N3)-methyltransferase
VSASEQCGRNCLAQLAQLTDFNRFIALPYARPRILFSPRATLSLADWARASGPQPLTMMVGPEGGFSEQEEQAAVDAGALALSLGPRVLRTETAALAAMAALGALWGGL